MHENKDVEGLRAVEAYRSACGAQPLMACSGRPGTGLRLYRWGIRPVREALVPGIREVTVTTHLGGARRVRVFTERGLSERFSRPGDITLIPRGQSIRWLVEGGADFATLHLPVAATPLFEDRTRHDLANLSECLFAFRDEYTLAGVRTLTQIGDASDPAASRHCALVLESLALHVARTLARGDAERLRLAQGAAAPAAAAAAAPRPSIDFEALRAEIDARLGEPITIDELAGLAGSGRSHFCEQFKQHFGSSPHRYILDRRIGRAKQLLAAGVHSLTALAYDLGFSSAAHFSTAFRNATGCSPRLFARGHARAPQPPAVESSRGRGDGRDRGLSPLRQ